MDNHWFLGAYWAARQESIEECADRALGFFDSLARCDARLAQWYRTGRSRKDALRKRVNATSREALLTLLHRGRARTDVGGEVIEDLGFALNLWNGAESASEAALHIKCGGYSEYVGNCVTIYLPEELADLKMHDRMRAVLEAVAVAWEPDWAGVSSEAARRLRKFNAQRPFVDWMLYVSRKWLPTVPAFESPAYAIPLGDCGTIIVVQEEPPDPMNPADAKRIEGMQTTLDRFLHVA